MLSEFRQLSKFRTSGNRTRPKCPNTKPVWNSDIHCMYTLFNNFCRGAQKQLQRTPPHLWTIPWVSEDRKTVQGALETFLVKLKPVNEPRVALTSRFVNIFAQTKAFVIKNGELLTCFDKLELRFSFFPSIEKLSLLFALLCRQFASPRP